MNTKVLLLVVLLASVAAGCERERRYLEKPATAPDPVALADGAAEQQPGEPGRGMRELATRGGYAESNAYEVSQGRIYYRWFNCVGCHAQGGGAIGPPLMDEKWIYGSKPDEIFATIMEGRPNGMPAFRGRIPEAQAWQIVAYVRSMSGLISAQAAPNRIEGMTGPAPESNRKPVRPDEKRPKQ